MSKKTQQISRYSATPTGVARPWGDEEIIVSKTDLKGHITYANDVFIRVALMDESELLGRPHNIIRHPDMPRCIFKLLWDTIQSGNEIFAYVINMAKNGDHYWVLAHVTPSFDPNKQIVGYHSNRRKPTDEQVLKIKGLYDTLLQEEARHSSPKDGLVASTKLLDDTIQDSGMSYDEFIFTI